MHMDIVFNNIIKNILLKVALNTKNLNLHVYNQKQKNRLSESVNLQRPVPCVHKRRFSF